MESVELVDELLEAHDVISSVIVAMTQSAGRQRSRCRPKFLEPFAAMVKTTKYHRGGELYNVIRYFQVGLPQF